jgi:hypothetical protein
MSENPFGFGGMFDPDDLNNAMRQFAEQAQESQSVAFADNAIHLAVQMTTAAQLRAAITVIYPECVALVREARQGLK